MSDASPRKGVLRNQKENLKHQQQEASQALSEQHKRFLELQIRKFRRHKLLQLHLLEQNLLHEVQTVCSKAFVVTGLPKEGQGSNAQGPCNM